MDLRHNQRNLYKNYLYLPIVNNEVYKKSAYISGINVLNHLPVNIKCIQNSHLFKLKLKAWLLDHVFYNLD